MTNEEAARIIKGIDTVQGDLPEDGDLVEIAMKMAIRALKQQSDMADVLDISQTNCSKWRSRAVKLAGVLGVKECDIDAFLLNQALNKAIEAGRRAIEPSNNTENACISRERVIEGDVISRQAAIDVLHGYFDGMLDTDTVCPKDIYGLFECIPSAQPKIGHWIRKKNALGEDITVCSECAKQMRQGEIKYCGACGAKMDSHIDDMEDDLK